MVLDDLDLSCKVSVANSNFPIYSSLIFKRKNTLRLILSNPKNKKYNGGEYSLPMFRNSSKSKQVDCEIIASGHSPERETRPAGVSNLKDDWLSHENCYGHSSLNTKARRLEQNATNL